MICRFLFSRRDMPLAQIVHNDKDRHVENGFAGKTLDQWPAVDIFRLYLSGKKEESQARYQEWYRSIFLADALVSKSRGGIEGGTLYRMLEGEHERQNRKFDVAAGVFDQEIFDRMLAARVAQRFAMIDSIREKGFVDIPHEPVAGLRRGGKIWLKDGHHRVAALAALGYDAVPAMIVLPSNFFLLLYRIERKILSCLKGRDAARNSGTAV